MTDDIIDSIRICGLSENEARVYLATLELGSASIWEVSKRSGVKRPTCYVLLEELTKKGFAISKNDGKRVVYSVLMPKQMAEMESRKHQKFIKSLPGLEAIASKSVQKPVITYFEGEIGVMDVYNSMIDYLKYGEILTYGVSPVKTNYTLFIDQFNKIRATKNILNRVLMADTKENRTAGLRDILDVKKTKYLPAKLYKQEIEINIMGDAIIYIAHSKTNPFVTVIENLKMAREEKDRFELLWLAAYSDESVEKEEPMAPKQTEEVVEKKLNNKDSTADVLLDLLN